MNKELRNKKHVVVFDNERETAFVFTKEEFEEAKDNLNYDYDIEEYQNRREAIKAANTYNSFGINCKFNRVVLDNPLNRMWLIMRVSKQYIIELLDERYLIASSDIGTRILLKIRLYLWWLL